MSEANSAGDVVYDRHGQAVFIGCGFADELRPRCAYCSTESAWICDGPGKGKFGRCGTPLCHKHRITIDEAHDFCRKHAAQGRTEQLLREADARFGAWLEAVETKAAPIGPRTPLPDANNIEPTHLVHRPRRRRQ